MLRFILFKMCDKNSTLFFFHKRINRVDKLRFYFHWTETLIIYKKAFLISDEGV